MKIPSPRESLLSAVHEICFVFSVAVSLSSIAGIVHGFLWLVSKITDEKTPKELLWFAYACDLVLAVIFVFFCVSLHLTRLSTHLKDVWSGVLKKANDYALARQNREALINPQRLSPLEDENARQDDEARVTSTDGEK
jgi:hypothetical protein